MNWELIKYLLLFTAVCALTKGNAQLFNVGQLYVDSSAVLFVDTSFQNSSSATLVNKGRVGVTGSFINNAAITGKGKVILSGSGLQNVSGTATMSNLELNGNGAIILPGHHQGIADTLTITAGTLYANGGLTLKSNAVNTARVSPIGNGSIVGDVTVERYIPDDGHRAWRLLAVPVTGAQTIRDAWQEGGRAISDSGTLITSNLYSASNGFDMSSNSPSLLIHDLADFSWTSIPVTNTNATRLDSRTGYMLFVRGDRTASASNSLHNATTLRSTGNVRQGIQPPISISNAGYTLVGNPYPSPIDFESIATTPNLAQSFYIWDANLSGTYGVGGYRLVQRLSANNYQQTPQAAGATVVDNSMRYIHSGQAFFLKASGADANVVFTEASKAAQVSSVNPFREVGLQPELLVNLMVPAGNTTALTDGIRVRFDNAYAASVTGEDAVKLTTFGENLASKRDNQLLIVENRPDLRSDDTIFLNMSNIALRNYGLEISGKNIPTAITAYLIDGYLNTQTFLNINSVTNVDFSVNNAPASAAADRFKLVFRTSATLPVTLTSLKAYQQGDNISVEWKVQNETAIRHYEVERSTDGRTFSTIATQVANGNNMSTVSYSSTDMNPITGNNFYRIRTVGSNGEIKYSSIEKVFIGKGKPGFTVYPNPILDNTINLGFTDQPKGMYAVRLLNQLGQVMLSKQISHEQGRSSEAIELSSKMAKGSYILEVTAPDNSKWSRKIMY